MVQSKLTLLALASTALAGVVRREEPEVDHLNPEDLSFPPPADWVTSAPHYFEGTGSTPTAFVQEFSDHSPEPHSTYLPSGLPSHFPQPTEEALPPFITAFPGAGEFAHTKDSAKPTSLIPAISHPVPLGASYEGPPPTFSEPIRPEEPQLNTPPLAFQASSDHPRIPSSHAETPYASPTKPPSFTEWQPRPSDPASVKPTEPLDGLDAVKPTSSPEIPSWISYLPPPSKSIPGPEGSEKDHDTAPSALPEAYQGPPPLPFDSIPGDTSEPHDSFPAGPHHTPPPAEPEQEPHPPPFDTHSGKPPGPESSSPAAAHQTPPPHGSYQEPPPFNFGPGGPHEESSSPAESHQTTPPPESYQGPPPSFTVPEEPKGSQPAGPHQIPPPPTEPYHESSPPSFDSAPAEPPKPNGSSPESYHLPPPSSPPSSHPSDADHPTEPATSQEGPSPYYGAVPPVSCTCSSLGKAPVDTHAPHPEEHDEQHPHPGETNPPPFTPPFENDKEPHNHELAPPHAVPMLEKPSVPHTEAYVPHFAQAEPTVTEPPFVSQAATPPMPSNCTEIHSKPAIPSPTGSKPQEHGTTGEHHIYGSPPSTHPTEASGVAERPSATKAAPEPSKTGVPKAGESVVYYSNFAPASAVPITALVGAFGALVFFFLQ